MKKHRYRIWAALALVLAVWTPLGAAAEDVSAGDAEDSGEEVAFTLGDAEAFVPEEEPLYAEDTIERWDPEDYYIPYPDVTSPLVRQQVSASERLYPGKLVWPLKGRLPLQGLTSRVGWRNAERIHRHQGGSWPAWLHHGVDVGGVGTDQQVVAADGGLAYAGERSGLGKYVVIDHGNGWYTRYQHLSAYAGDVTDLCRAVPVAAGDPIGYVGNTGGDYPVHLHFELVYSPDGPGADDVVYQRETHNRHIRAYSFPQQGTVLLRWADRWEICTAEKQTYVEPEPEETQEPGEPEEEENRE